MRAKALKLNMITMLFSEMVALVCGLVLPRIILVTFGSSLNGLVSSITQFLNFSVVLRAGVGGVTKAALYKPLADKDTNKINAIMVATSSYMKKIGLIIASGVLVFSFVYPFMVANEFSLWYSCFMVIILGTATFAENYFGIKNMLLLQADQKMYIQNLISTFAYIASFGISIILIWCGFDMLVVKLGTIATFMLKPLLFELYVRKHYNLNMTVEPDHSALKNRWDAFAQQLAIIINGNIDIILITMFSTLANVSVYTVHFMVLNNIAKVVQAPIYGFGATFGNMMAKGENDNLRRTFSFLEWAVFAFATLVFSVSAVMISPFVSIYTNSITDVDYYHPFFAFALVVVIALNTVRMPYQYLVDAAGHFKQTRNGAIIEVVVHIVVSCVLLVNFGIIGVVIGALLASIIRTLQYSVYAMGNILCFSVFHIVKNYFVYATCFAICVLVCSNIPFPNPNGYFDWCIVATCVTIISFVIVVLVSVLFNTKDVKYLYNRIVKKNKFIFK